MAQRKEQREIVLDGVRISYMLERKSVKNINLRMRPSSGLSVSAPYRVTLAQVEAVLRQYQTKILETLGQYATTEQEHRRQYPDEYVTGETVLYLGKEYSLRTERATKECVQIQGNQLRLLVKNPGDRESCKRVFDGWWECSCQKAVRNLCRAVFPVFEAQGVAFPEIRFRYMVSQWGNCRPKRGILTFNYRLLAAPVRCMEYVVIHEFSHFLYPNHSAAFYQCVAQELPDWRQLQEILQKTVETRLKSEKTEE